MKLLPMLLLNVATVVVAIGVYDLTRDRPTGSSPVIENGSDGSADLERRVAALETEPPPALVAAGIDPRIQRRLADLEATMKARTVLAGPAEAEPRLAGPASAEREAPAALTAPGETDEPSADDIRRFRALQKAVKREERIRKNRARVDKTLNALALNLSSGQRKRVHTAYAAFQPRVAEIWTAVKVEARETIAAGGTVDRGEIVTSTTALIQEEFAKSLGGIVPTADAEALAGGLMPGGR